MNTKKYTKKEIVQRVADRLSQPEVKTAELVTSTLDVLREMMSEDNDSTKIELRNFGTFSIKKAKAKPRARNPRTNEEIYVPPHRKSHFKPGKILRNALRKPL
ncbi:MAG: DNA-binding protein [Candidatus Marinimicrobia bacterium]|nr:DNA-binding protein [Candidatus Neomarinimicrobiota bacterium]|tara:strand:- start:26465 stop:26773 length:309 start_codon:yes stop_codon:yes gene_type:complete